MAQALHRKANRTDVDAVLAKKADAGELHRVRAALEDKVDVASFESLARLIEQKADRTELREKTVTAARERQERTDVERALGEAQRDKEEAERRMRDLEEETRNQLRGLRQDLDATKNSLAQSLSKKADFRDLEVVKSVGKSESENVASLVSKLRAEVQENVARARSDALNARSSAEDVMRREQVEREVTRAMQEIEGVRRALQEVDSRKVEKRELIEAKSKLMGLIEPKVELSEVQSAINMFNGEVSSKLYDMKAELGRELGATHESLNAAISAKVSFEEMQEALLRKADDISLRKVLELKCNVADFEVLREQYERLMRESDARASKRELENLSEFMRSSFEDLHKELLLRATIKVQYI